MWLVSVRFLVPELSLSRDDGRPPGPGTRPPDLPFSHPPILSSLIRLHEPRLHWGACRSPDRIGVRTRAPTASGCAPLTRPVALRRLFVLGIGFFSLCFLMTSLGGQFSARRSGDSPFTIRTEGISMGEGRQGGCRCLGMRRGRPLSLAHRRWLSVALSQASWPPHRCTCELSRAVAWAA